MADTKVSALAAAAAALAAMELPVNDAGVSKKVTLTQIRALLQTLGMPRVFALAADHDNLTVTGTEVTGLGPVTLEAGTYEYRYQLICQSTATATGIGLGINFTGTAAVRTIRSMYPTTGAAAATGIMDDVAAAGGIALVEHNTQTAFSTTAPNMVNTAGFATANANVPVTIEGILVVTAAGDLELWHSSETAVSTKVKAGSSLVVVRTA